jgi:hypothetical protein
LWYTRFNLGVDSMTLEVFIPSKPFDRPFLGFG